MAGAGNILQYATAKQGNNDEPILEVDLDVPHHGHG